MNSKNIPGGKKILRYKKGKKGRKLLLGRRYCLRKKNTGLSLFEGISLGKISKHGGNGEIKMKKKKA